MNKNIYLISAIIFFILLMIPYFQNVAMDPPIVYFFINKTFTWMYIPILLFGMIEGVLIYKSVETLINNIKNKKPVKFDLS